MRHGLQWLMTMVAMLLWSGICIAQGDAAPVDVPVAIPVAEIPTADWLMMLIAAIGGMKGMSALGIAAAVSQLLLKLMSTPLAKFSGKYKLLAVTGLTLISGVLGLMMIGNISIMAALMHSTTLAAFQVFVHQIWKQFVAKSAEKAET